MSTLTDKAKAEADEVEQAEPDETEEEEAAGGEPEPDTTPAPDQLASPPALTEQQAEREFAKLEKKASTYLEGALAIARTLEIPVQMCPLCTFPGLAIPRQAHEVTSDIEGAVLSMIGHEPKPTLKRSEAYQRCAECDGWGEVDTDAQKEISKAAVCPNPLCGGKGYVTVSLDRTPATVPNVYPGAQVSYTPLPAGLPDTWGRPAGHPHWGLDPAMVGSPNGQTVG